jgi:protein tyrosine phosphatase (PTP) superfamily phosphohydrolase (DUF442 family)
VRQFWASLRGAARPARTSAAEAAGGPPATSPTGASSPVPKPRWSLDGPAARRRAAFHYHLLDHAVLRRSWTNMHQVAPGVWRSNHPTHARLRDLKAMGIRTILNLRGAGETPPFLFEHESCRALGLELRSVGLSARAAPRRDELLKLFDAFRTMERPFVMHCKSGADRAGLAAALYLLAHGAPLAEARRQLSWRFLHVRHSRTGILDHVLDLYGARLRQGPIGIEDWVRDEYDRDAAMASWRRW